MGDITLPRRMFLWCVALIYLIAFVSLYAQIPGETCTFACARAKAKRVLTYYSRCLACNGMC